MLYFPNPAISARKNGRFFPEFANFFQIRTHKQIITTHRGPIYQIKAHEKPYRMDNLLDLINRCDYVGL